MTRKRIIYLILIISGIGAVIFNQFFDYRYSLLVYALYIPFHIISLIYYRESKMITTYHVLQITNLFGYFMLVQFGGIFFRLFGLISFIGTTLTIIIAFGVILQHKTFKINERSFMWFSVYGLIFFSIYQPYILNLLASFFGTLPMQIRATANAFYMVRTILLGANVVLQLLCVHHNEINIYLEKYYQKNKKETNKVSDLPFFE